MKHSVAISRVIVGVLFISSGLIKADDPLGLSYKMQEFFEVWGWHSFNDFTLGLSVMMIAFEIIAGVAVLLGWEMRLFSWLLLLLTIFFTFLTGYALFSGKIRECGCFGDCIPLSAQQSFIKDLVLLLLILLIFFSRNRIRAALSTAGSVGTLIVAAAFSFAFQWYVLRYLPVVDCLPYRAGKNIPRQMKVPPGAIQDSTEISFVYEKNGKELEFTADRFPQDFNDSLYHFVKRYDKLIRPGNAVVPIRDFALGTIYGNDTTTAVLTAPGYSALIFTSGFSEIHPGWLDNFNSMYELIHDKKMPLYFITNDFDNVSSWVRSNRVGQDATVLKCDFVAIKTAARANPTVYLLKQGTIVNKWSYANFNKATAFIKSLK